MSLKERPVLANKPAARPSHMGVSRAPRVGHMGLVAMGEGSVMEREEGERQKGKKSFKER